MQKVTELRRERSPTVAPQALAWDGSHLWLSSRDLGTLYKIDVTTWQIVDELDPPGIVWAAVLAGDHWRLTVGKGLNDDRYVYGYAPGEGFSKLFACPDFTGSYLSYDGEYLYLSQWYKGRILKLDERGETLSEMNVGAEISGHTIVDGALYVLRGTEQNGESWRIARVSLDDLAEDVEDVAVVPFAARSLTWDGQRFWSNHRAANETISFTIGQR